MARKVLLIRIAVGIVIILSFLLFFLYSYNISDIIPSGILKEWPNEDVSVSSDADAVSNISISTFSNVTASSKDAISTNITTPSKVAISSEVTLSSKETTTVATPTIAFPEANTRLNASQLDVEQIEADFPQGYVNPNPWFKTPGQPNATQILPFLSDEEKASLPGFSAQAQHSTRQLEKITSFYGINRTGSWNDHIENLDDEGLAPLTKWIQNYIYDHQHPANCNDKKFYLLRNQWTHHGLGALIRRISVELSNAIQANRILVFNKEYAPGNTLVDKNCARHRGKAATLECIIEEITSCSEYATEENSVDQIDESEYPDGVKSDLPPLPYMALVSYMDGTDLSTTGTFLRYWWRSQMYGYILRPNRPTLERIAEMRLNQTLHRGVATTRQDLEMSTNLTVPFPLPPSTISIHIRHGDKAGEGRLISTRDYIVAAERFVLRNPLSYRKRAFLSTEDPDAIKEALYTPFVNPVKSYANLDWNWYFSNIQRVDAGPQANLKLTHNKTDALITHVLQLWMAVECDTFVGNRNSNWNKMIDALRCTLMDKCHLPYLDAGYVADWINFP